MSVVIGGADELRGVELRHNLVSRLEPQHSHEEGHGDCNLLEGLSVVLAPGGCGVDEVVDGAVDQRLLALLALLLSGEGEVDLVLLVIDVRSLEDEREHGPEVRIEVRCEQRGLESLLVHVLEDDAR